MNGTARVLPPQLAGGCARSTRPASRPPARRYRAYDDQRVTMAWLRLSVCWIVKRMRSPLLAPIGPTIARPAPSPGIAVRYNVPVGNNAGSSKRLVESDPLTEPTNRD